MKFKIMTMKMSEFDLYLVSLIDLFEIFIYLFFLVNSKNKKGSNSIWVTIRTVTTKARAN